tara:strand:+ start:2004 stop:4283 length:2280 start_codon:yes stop_codon:yes gene_type:complete
MWQTIADKLINWRYLSSILLLLISGWLAASLGNFGFNADFRIFFDDDDPLLIAYENMEQEFTHSYTQIFILEAKNGDLFSPEKLAAIQWFNDQAWRLPFTSRVLSIANHQHTIADGDDLWVEDLFDPYADKDPDYSQHIKDIVLAEPELKDRLINSAGNISLVIAYLNIAEEQQDQKPMVMQASRDLAEKFSQLHPSVSVKISGQLAVDANIVEIAERDAINVELRMFFCLLILLAFFLRSIAAVVASLIIMVVSVVAATGFLGLVYTDFNGINMSTPYIVYMMAILDCVHILSAYFSRLNQGMDKYSAMKDSLSKNMEALLITSLTTAVGFLAMNFADSPPFREFGTATAFGVMFAFVASVTLLPAIMLLLPGKKVSRPPVSGLVNHCQALFKRHGKKYLPIGWLVIAIMVPAALSNTTNHESMSAFHKDAPIRVATEYLDRELSGSELIDYLLRSTGPGDIVEPEFLQSVDRFATWLEQQPEVLKVSGYHQIIKRLNKTMHGDDRDYYVIPDDRRAIAEYLLVYESSIPEELDLQDSINIDKSAIRVTAMMAALSSQEVLAFNQRVLNKLALAGPAVTSFESSSPPLMMAYVAQSNILSMLQGCLFVAAFVCLSMIIAFRSIRLGLLCMIPNLLPAIVAFGLCGLFIGEIDMGTAMIFSMTLGIVVDDTIHFVVSYRRQRLQGNSPELAVDNTYALVGRAIIITSLVLCIGYLIPVFTAELRMNVQMYALSVVCIATAMIADLFFLPSLLVKTDKYQ